MLIVLMLSFELFQFILVLLKVLSRQFEILFKLLVLMLHLLTLLIMLLVVEAKAQMNTPKKPKMFRMVFDTARPVCPTLRSMSTKKNHQLMMLMAC